FRNKYVWGAIALSVLILMGMYAIVPVRNVLSLYEMSASDWIISVSASIISLIIIQVVKKLKIIQQ
ncbi:MAG: cation transporting ATPase C-terminal domain-containing protein, partial [Bacteroidota bacterium]|nr:cation transporting ATPase C-terminal domain-containing protein [Bacteroidota bacterium]